MSTDTPGAGSRAAADQWWGWAAEYARHPYVFSLLISLEAVTGGTRGLSGAPTDYAEVRRARESLISEHGTLVVGLCPALRDPMWRTHARLLAWSHAGGERVARYRRDDFHAFDWLPKWLAKGRLLTKEVHDLLVSIAASQWGVDARHFAAEVLARQASASLTPQVVGLMDELSTALGRRGGVRRYRALSGVLGPSRPGEAHQVVFTPGAPALPDLSALAAPPAPQDPADAPGAAPVPFGSGPPPAAALIPDKVDGLILRALAQAGRAVAIVDLAVSADMSDRGCSKRLRHLIDAGYVGRRSRRSGFFITDAGRAKLAGMLSSLPEEGDAPEKIGGAD